MACKDQQKEELVVVTIPAVSEEFAKFLQTYYVDRLDFFPLEATSSGIEGYNHLLPNTLSYEYRNELQGFYNNTADELIKFNKSDLTAEEKISYDIIDWECKVGLKKLSFRTDLLPINQFESLHLTMATLGSGQSMQPFKTLKDYNDWLERLDKYTIWLDTAKARMIEGMEVGTVLPKSLVVKMIPQFSEMTKQNIEKHLFYGPMNQLPDNISSEDSLALNIAYGLIIKDKLIPRFIAMTEFLEKEYLPNARISSGIDSTLNGQAYYQAQIVENTTTKMTADEIHELGLKEVARLRNEMSKVMKTVNYTGSLTSFFNYVRKKKKLIPFTDPNQVIENFNNIHDRMKPNLAKLFDLTPKTPFEVRRTEAFREATASAEYMPGSLDGTRPGIFYVPIPDIKKYNLYADEDLFLHEAIPGHHYQISLQQENTSLPNFRKTLWYSAYGEGWALYSESLGKELGLYTDPYQYFGMLSAEMHRAIRLVVDTGIHSKGWSREKAIKYSLKNEAESEESIIAEIERYMSWPGQALSYKVGQLKILELRDKCSKNKTFDIKKFHNYVLESGCVPLAVLENKLLSVDWK
jgi:uncharacterized protein (DUF885 family)